MRDILNIGKSGMGSYQDKIDIVSNNIANVNTEGYKKIDKSFIELIRTEIGNRGTPISDNLAEDRKIMSSGLSTSQAYRDFGQGILLQTNDSLKVAIDGKGYFAVEGLDGEPLLTRNIRFNIDEDGKLVDQNGYEIEVDNLKDLSGYNNGDIMISEKGEISVEGPNGGVEKVGQLVLYRPENEQKLISQGKSYYSMPDDLRSDEAYGGEEGFGQVRQGFVENSNVDMGEEMVELIIAQRAYQMSSKSIEAADDMWRMANNLRG